MSTVEQQVPVEFKQTEVGLVPDDWDCVTLGDLGDIVRGGSPRPAGDPKYFNGNYIPWLTVASLTNIPASKQEVTSTLTKLTELGSKQSRILDAGTLIISNSGATLGVAKILGLKCCANDGVAAIINQKKGNKSFITHYINTQTKRLHDDVATGNGQPNLNTDLIKLIPIPFPSESEQAAIANALSDVDALLTQLEKLIAKKQAIKTATMQQLLTGKTRLPQFATYTEGAVEGKSQGQPKGTKSSELGEIPKDWDVVPIAKLTRNIIDYRGRTPRKLGMDWGGGDIVALSAGNVKKGYIDFEEECYLGSDTLYKKWMKNGDIEQNDIVFTMEAPLGNVALIPDSKRYILSQRTILLQLNREEYDPIFVYQLMMSNPFQNLLSDSATGSTAQGIKRTRFEQLLLSLPSSKEEQTAIATILSDMDNEIQALEQRLAKTRQIKQGMMQELLTGRTRLPFDKD